MNDLFATLADPAVFTDQAGSYVATKHLHSLPTVEQLFRRVLSIQTTHRDANARRTLLFTVLDTLERLTGWDITKLCSLPFAKEKLEWLRSAMPPEAAEVLIPGAERAVEALKRLHDGFFIKRHTGAEYIEWHHSVTGTTKISAEEAGARLVKLLRDATHGHGSNRTGSVIRTNALLVFYN